MDGWLQIEEGFEEWEDTLQKIFWGSEIKYYKLLFVFVGQKLYPWMFKIKFYSLL